MKEQIKWFVEYSDKFTLDFTVSPTRRDTIRLIENKYNKMWPKLKMEGYRCIKCRVVPINEARE
jgi:hypothetical protein